MKISIYISFLFILFSCSEQRNEDIEINDLEIFIIDFAEERLKGISDFERQEISSLVYNYSGKQTDEIIRKLTKIVNSTEANDEVSILYGLEMINRTLVGVDTDSSSIIYRNTKLLVDSLIHSYEPIYSGFGSGTMNSYKFVLLKDNIFRVYWRSFGGVNLYQGKWIKIGVRYTLLQDVTDEERYRYCFLEGDTLYECNSDQIRIMQEADF